MSKTSNELLLDSMLRHQIYLLRYSKFVSGRVNTILKSSEQELSARIQQGLGKGSSLNNLQDWKRLQALQKALASLREKSWQESINFLEKEMADLAFEEPVQFSGIVSNSATVVITTVMPDTRLLKSIATSRPFQGRLLKEWASAMQADDIRRIHASIQNGMISGEGISGISKRVFGTLSANGTDGILEISRRQVTAITRTAVQHISNESRREWLSANKDLFDKELYVATLDSRTTPICRSLDGKEFEVGKGQYPPLHIACRSLRVASLSGEAIGERPAKPFTEKMILREYSEKESLKNIKNRDSLPRGKKGSYDAFKRQRIKELTGQVPSKTTYEQFIKRQSNEFQDDVLGTTKAKLFRNGGLTLDKFVNRVGDELTLNELVKRHAEAFRKAGLDPDNYN